MQGWFDVSPPGQHNDPTKNVHTYQTAKFQMQIELLEKNKHSFKKRGDKKSSKSRVLTGYCESKGNQHGAHVGVFVCQMDWTKHCEAI